MTTVKFTKWGQIFYPGIGALCLSWLLLCDLFGVRDQVMLNRVYEVYGKGKGYCFIEEFVDAGIEYQPNGIFFVERKKNGGREIHYAHFSIFACCWIRDVKIAGIGGVDKWGGTFK